MQIKFLLSLSAFCLFGTALAAPAIALDERSSNSIEDGVYGDGLGGGEGINKRSSGRIGDDNIEDGVYGDGLGGGEGINKRSSGRIGDDNIEDGVYGDGLGGGEDGSGRIGDDNIQDGGYSFVFKRDGLGNYHHGSMDDSRHDPKSRGRNLIPAIVEDAFQTGSNVGGNLDGGDRNSGGDLVGDAIHDAFQTLKNVLGGLYRKEKNPR